MQGLNSLTGHTPLLMGGMGGLGESYPQGALAHASSSGRGSPAGQHGNDYGDMILGSAGSMGLNDLLEGSQFSGLGGAAMNALAGNPEGALASAAGWGLNQVPGLEGLGGPLVSLAQGNVGGAIGAYLGSMIPIPVFGTVIGSVLGDILGDLF